MLAEDYILVSVDLQELMLIIAHQALAPQKVKRNIHINRKKDRQRNQIFVK